MTDSPTTKKPAADAPDANKRTRKPSEFSQTVRLALFGHKKLLASLPSAKAFGDAIVAAGFLNGDNSEAPNAIRVVTRTREGSKSSVKSVSLYVAENGYEFPEQDGFRIDNAIWDALRPQLEARGLSADEDGLKQLAAMLAAGATATPA